MLTHALLFTVLLFTGCCASGNSDNGVTLHQTGSGNNDLLIVQASSNATVSVTLDASAAANLLNVTFLCTVADRHLASFPRPYATIVPSLSLTTDLTVVFSEDDGETSLSCFCVYAAYNQTPPASTLLGVQTDALLVISLRNKDISDELKFTMSLVSVTVIFMIGGSLIAAYFVPGPKLKSCFSHLAAGVVIASVTTELVPKLQTDTTEWWPVLVGFAVGVILMLIVSYVTDTCDAPNTEDDGQEDSTPEHGNHDHYNEKDGLLTSRAPPSASDVESGRRKTVKFPTAFLFAVFLDVLIDGILIGVSGSSGLQSGVLITFALTIEMTFLGVTLSTSLAEAGLTLWKRIVIVVVLPIAMFLGSAVGTIALGSISESSPGYICVVSFATAALLWLASEELIPDAHEVEGVDNPAISSLFFIGFIVVLMIDKLLPEE